MQECDDSQTIHNWNGKGDSATPEKSPLGQVVVRYLVRTRPLLGLPQPILA